MARILALDWDQKHIHLIAATVSRGKVRITHALRWEEQAGPDPASAAAVGQRLRMRLREAGIAAAPVLACIGRERVILKVVRYPKVDPAQEPAVVRFQAAKELTEPAESVLIDYSPLAKPGPGGEQHAHVLIVRRQLVAAYQELCRAAGLKLLALTPRSFGVAACPGQAADGVAAVVTVAEGWAEFCVVRGSDVLFARPLTAGDHLPAEVRRNLTLYAGQTPANLARDAVQSLRVAGNGEQSLFRERLQELLTIPVSRLDPLAGQDNLDLSGDRAGFTAAVGLVHLWGRGRPLPINFVSPKEPKQTEDPGKHRKLLVAAAGVVAVLLAVLLGNMVLAARRAEVEQRQAEKEESELLLKRLLPDSKNASVLKEWDDSALPWLDELYDLSARFPYRVGVRITQLTVNPLPSHGKDPFVARATITGVVPREDVALVYQLMDTINRDSHCRAAVEVLKSGSGSTADPGQAVQEFTLRVDLARQPAARYTTRLEPPPRPAPEKARDRPEEPLPPIDLFGEDQP